MSIYVNSGMYAYDYTLTNNFMHVLSGGTADKTTLNSGGSILVSSGGTANRTTVNFRGGLHISGTGAVANTATVMHGGLLRVYSGATVNSATVSSGGELTILGGWTNNAFVRSAGSMNVLSGGVAYETVVSKGGEMYVLKSGGMLGGAVRGGKVEVFSGGMAMLTTVSNGGVMAVSRDGAANFLIVSSGGSVFLSSGGVASGATISSGGTLFVYPNGAAYSATVLSEGLMSVNGSGAVAHSTTVRKDGRLWAWGSGRASSSIVSSGGVLNVFSNGSAYSTTVSSGGSLYVSSGAKVFNTTLSSGGELFVKSGGVASRTTANNAGRVNVFSSGTAVSTTVSGGYMEVFFGGVANSTTVVGDSMRVGNLWVSQGGTAVSTTLSSGGILRVCSDGTAVSTHIGSGSAAINVGGVISSTVMDGGSLGVDGVARDTVVVAGGSITLYSGAKHTGRLSITSDTVVVAKMNSVIDFDISALAPGDFAPVNNLSYITGNPNYTVTVSVSQTAGRYKLADIAGSFDKTVTVVTDTGTRLGNLAFGGTLRSGGYSYSLAKSGGALALTVEGGAGASPRSDLLSNSYSQIVAWDKEQGKVGYVATNGNVGPAWCGIWEWSGSEAAMWRVVGVGHFSGSTVDHDGILLYNGYGNTFAAWTDLNDPSYGYVSLCHVDGNFQTKTLTDLDGDDFDDVLIYDEKGSFGVVLDAAEYHDIWHVSTNADKVQQLIGAGNFGSADGLDSLLVKKTDENAYFLWHNNDPTFATWNWSQTYIGSLDNDWSVAGIGDFSGDGIDDIAMWRKSTGEIQIWENAQASHQRYAGTLSQTDWEVAAVGDYNGDGKEDLLLREKLSGWGGVGYWAGADATQWTDLNARIETDMESKFTVIAG